ncbi:MAG TPA: DUF3035 domain-containing protein [Allosphingosinicella sp.]|jgi:hypothetical protein
MRLIAITLPAALVLAGCAAGGPLGRERPDEFAVTRAPELVIPPEFNLTPPRPGQADPGAADPRSQALQALFGGPQPRSAVEQRLLQQADAAGGAALGARSVAGDPETQVVNRGALVQTIIQLPEGDGPTAVVNVPR